MRRGSRATSRARGSARRSGAGASPRRRRQASCAAARGSTATRARSSGSTGRASPAGGAMRTRSKEQDARAIAHHYDVSNDFYALFLDPLMVYTCAYYRDPDGKLEQAQMDKLDLVCRKLRLRPGETLLDIGCGWGALSIWAAQHHGVRAHGVTLSRAQAEYAAERIRREGLEGRCLVEYRDFRDLPAEGGYGQNAAGGVIEHVGIRNYPAFFGRVG